MGQTRLALLVHHEDELDHRKIIKLGMLLFRRGFLFCSSIPKSSQLPKRVPGVNSVVREIVAELDDEMPFKRAIESKPVRQRKRRNVMQRVYGTSYDHGMDDYK